MFVDQLSETEKKGMLQLLIAIAKADGDISEEEAQFIKHYANEYHMHDEMTEEVSLDSACALLDSPKAKVIAMQEIIKIALSDGHYDVTEKQGAQAIASLLSLPLAQFQAIENWVMEGQAWVQKGEAMLEPA